jgi:outer membrane protein
MVSAIGNKLYKSIQVVLLFSLMMLFAGLAYGQEKWSLNECIAYAIEHNLQSQRFELMEKIAHEDFNQSKRNLLPYIGASSNAGMSFGRSIDPNTNLIVNTEFFNNSYNLGGSIDLFRGWMLQNQIQYQKFRMQARSYERQDNLDMLAFSIMTDFFEVIYYREMAEIAEEQVKLSELSLKKAEKLSEAGLKAKTDLLEVIANLEQERLLKIQVENRLDKALLSLKQKMNLPPDKSIEPDSPTLPLVVSSYQQANTASLFAQFSNISPGLQSAQASYESMRQYVDIARARLYPSLVFNASANTGFYETNRDNTGKTIPFRSQVNNNRSQFTGLSLQIPLFSRGSSRSEVRKAKLYLEEAETYLEQTKQQLWFEIQNNNNEMSSLSKELEQTKRRLEADELAFDAAEKKFDQGLTSSVEYFTAKNRLATTKSQGLQTRLQWEIKNRINEFYEGKRFWE